MIELNEFLASTPLNGRAQGSIKTKLRTDRFRSLVERDEDGSVYLTDEGERWMKHIADNFRQGMSVAEVVYLLNRNHELKEQIRELAPDAFDAENPEVVSPEELIERFELDPKKLYPKIKAMKKEYPEGFASFDPDRINRDGIVWLGFYHFATRYSWALRKELNTLCFVLEQLQNAA